MTDPTTPDPLTAAAERAEATTSEWIEAIGLVLDSEAALCDRPGQMARLERAARDLRAIASRLPAPTPAVDRDLLETIAADVIADAVLEERWPRASEFADALISSGHVTRARIADRADGAALITAERHRVVSVKGYTPEHDDQHVHGELLDAAICYACDMSRIGIVDALWPWAEDAWKPTPDDRIQELTKAGQFIAAEIDRLRRAEEADHAG